MRIGIITGEFPPMQGGVGDYTARLGQALAECGAKISILTDVRGTGAYEHMRVTNNIRAWNPRSWLAARAWEKAEQVDIVNLQFQTAAYAMSPWVHFLPDILPRVPFVTTFHDVRAPYLFPKAGGLRSQIVRQLARRSAAIITTTQHDAAWLGAGFRTAIIPIGSNIIPRTFTADERVQQRTAWGIRDEFLIGYFGLLNKTKGLIPLLEAFAQFRSSHEGTRLVIIGGTPGASDISNAAFQAELQQTIDLLGLRSSIIFTGYLTQDDVSAALAACDVVALPYVDGASYRRGSLMAALALGCAVVTTTPSDDADAFVDQQNLLAVPPEDPESLCRALMHLYEQPALRATLGKAALETSRRFSWNSIAHHYLNFFQQVIGLHHAR